MRQIDSEIFMKKQPILPNERFNETEFARQYAEKHTRMSVKLGNKITAMLSKKSFKHGVILDSGCGSGETIIEIAKKFPSCDFYGIDLSDPLLEIANEKKRKENLTDRVKFLKADAQDIPFPSNYFDLVININMLHLMSEPLAMLNQIGKVLKPEGLFFITDLKRSVLGYLEKEIKSSYSGYEAREIIAKSNLPAGQFTSDMIWWCYQNI